MTFEKEVMNKLRFIITAGLLALSVATLSARTPQEGDPLLRNQWSLYLQGGATMAEGLAIESVNAPAITDYSPLYGLGVSYHANPWLRLSLNYEFTKYNREQRYSSFQPLSQPQLSFPDMELSEMSGGRVYNRTWNNFHNIDFTFDLNIPGLWADRGCTWFNLYLSTGFGYSIANGNSYDLSMGYERWTDKNMYSENQEIYNWVNADNVRHEFMAPYVPANLALEFNLSSSVTIGAKALYKYMISDDKFAPKHLMSAVAVVRFNL